MNEFFQIVTSKASLEAKFNALHGYAQYLGFQDIFYARLIQPDIEARFHEDNVLSLRIGCPEWKQRYVQEGFRSRDWAIEHSATMAKPFRFDQPPGNLTRRQKEFCKQAQKYNRQNGFGLPIRGPFGLTAGFSATGHVQKLDAVTMAKMTAAAQFFDLEVGSDITLQSAQTYSLTEREIRLLRLYVNGRSMAQIAHFLGSSEQWIRKSFLSMRRKLNAGSNSELVYRAVTTQLI